MNRSDEKLNQLLKSVKVVPPRSNLAERIIAQSLPLSENQPDPNTQILNVNKESLIKQILRSLVFPKPVYALACSMLVGVLVGWQSPDVDTHTMQVTSTAEELSSLFLAEVNFDE